MDLFLTFAGLLFLQGLRRLPPGGVAVVRAGPLLLWIEGAERVWRPPALLLPSFEVAPRKTGERGLDAPDAVLDVGTVEDHG